MSNLSSRAGELKSQGAAMAAQTPDNKVAAEDAEGVITNESKKAGIPAFQFDPDASPEDKAAQARSVRPLVKSTFCIADIEQHVPPGFHHDKKPKGVGIATDIVCDLVLLHNLVLIYEV